MKVVVCANDESKEYFFSTSHTQPDLPSGFVPTTHTLPEQVPARPGLPTGIMENPEHVAIVYYKGMTEISNPKAAYQP